MVCDAVVVEADGGQAVGDRAVAGDVHQVRAVAQRAELVGRGEAGARVGGLVADGAVVLGGVPDGLVDGEPEVGRVDDQVVRARDHARRLDLLGEQLGNRGELGLEVPAVAGEVLPAAARGGGERIHGLEAAGGPVDGGRGDGGRDAHPLLERRGAREVGVELALADLGDARLDVVDAVGREQAARPLGEQGDLVAGRHVERVERVRGDPHGVGVDGLGGPLDPLPRDRGEGARDLDGLLGGGCGALGGEVAVRGEAPDAVDEHPDGQPDHRLVDDAGDRPVAQRDRLGEDPLDADVGVLGAAVAGAIERGVGEGGERQRAELRVDAVEHGLQPRARAPRPAGRIRQRRALLTSGHRAPPPGSRHRARAGGAGRRRRRR